MNLKEILEKSESKVLDESIIVEIEKHFNDKLDEKAESKAQELFEAKEKEYQDSLDEMVKTVSETIKEELKENFDKEVDAKSKEICEAYTVYIQEEVDKEMKVQLDEITSRNKSYLEHSVQAFVDEALPVWEAEVKVQKADQLMKDFKELSEAFGVKVESLDEDTKISEANEKINKMLETEITLKKEVLDLKKKEVLQEALKGLDTVKVDRINSLLEKESLDEVSLEDYTNKVELYKNAVGDTPSKIEEIKKDKDDNIPAWKKKLKS